jgi:hypothetical protein
MRNLHVPLLLTLPFTPLTLAGINWDVFEYGVVPSFKWSRPFPDDGTDPGGFHVNCRAEGTFHAKLYKLKDLPLDPPTGLSPWHDAIEVFLSKRDFMGSWDGVDHKGNDREIVVMEYVDVPGPVREWIEAQQQQTDERDKNGSRWMFAVFEKPKKEGEKVYTTVRPKVTPHPAPAEPTSSQQEQGHGQAAGQMQERPVEAQEHTPDIPDKDKIVVFPAGAVYEILPLWVAKGSKCESKIPPHSKGRSHRKP